MKCFFLYGYRKQLVELFFSFLYSLLYSVVTIYIYRVSNPYRHPHGSVWWCTCTVLHFQSTIFIASSFHPISIYDKFPNHLKNRSKFTWIPQMVLLSLSISSFLCQHVVIVPSQIRPVLPAQILLNFFPRSFTITITDLPTFPALSQMNPRYIHLFCWWRYIVSKVYMF